MPSIEQNADVGIDNALVAKITVPVLYQEDYERFGKFVTSDNKFFVTSAGSFYIVRS